LERQLAEIAAAFVQLQEARQWADYDLMQTFDRIQVVDYVDQARVAMAKWKMIRKQSKYKRFPRGPISPQQVE
jgi:hypothetical protein